MSFHLNLGLRYKLPFESDYSITRRFLIANDGIPWTELKRELNNQNDVLKGSNDSVVSKISYLETKTPSKHPINCFQANKACPQCLKQLYHTELFNCEWLTHCPIHNCILESKCPECQLEWPSINEIGYRRCILCARTNIIERKNLKLLTLTGLDIKPILEIYNFILDSPTSSKLGNKGNIYDTGLYGVTEKRHPLYLSFKDKYLYHLKKKSLKKKIQRYKIVSPTLNLIKSELSPANYLEAVDCLVLMRKDLLETRALVFSELLKCINKISCDKHTPTLSSYTDISITKASNSCPFCMALSMWFFFVQAYPYESEYKFNFDDYSLLRRRIGPYRFYEPKALSNFFVGENTYQISKDFILWSYKRSLEICFVDMLEMCFLITSNSSGSNDYEDLVDHLYMKNKCVEYFYFKKNRTLYFYNNVKNPLSLIYNLSYKQKKVVMNCNLNPHPGTQMFFEPCSTFDDYGVLEEKFLKYLFSDSSEWVETRINNWFEEKKTRYISSISQFEFDFW